MRTLENLRCYPCLKKLYIYKKKKQLITIINKQLVPFRSRQQRNTYGEKEREGWGRGECKMNVPLASGLLVR